MAANRQARRILRALWELCLDSAAVGDPSDKETLPKLVEKAVAELTAAARDAAGGPNGHR